MFDPRRGNMMAYLLMLLNLFLVTAAQALLKKGIQIGKERGHGRFSSLLHPYVPVAAAMALISPFLYVGVVSRLGLSSSFGLNALSYPLVFLLSRLFLSEESNSWHWSGLILISAGVFFWSL